MVGMRYANAQLLSKRNPFLLDSYNPMELPVPSHLNSSFSLMLEPEKMANCFLAVKNSISQVNGKS